MSARRSIPPKVSYVTMRFPAPSEAFAAVDIRALQSAGLDVSVHAMRSRLPGAAKLSRERRLSSLRVSHGTFAAEVRGLLAAIARPALLARLVTWIVRCSWRRPVHLFVSLVLVPRSISILVELERHRPDVIHLFWGHYPSIVGYLVLTAMPEAVLTIFLGAYDLTHAYGGSAWVARRADFVATHALCNVSVVEHLGVPRDRILVAYRGIDATCFNGKSARKVPRRVVAAGRLETAKAMDDVLLAFRDARSTWPDATLRIVGQGPCRKTLERLAEMLGLQNAVTFVGHISQSELARELSEAEVFLHLSWEETERLPNVLKEAMASGCVCIAAVSPGIEELLRDGESGILVARRDWKAAASCIDDVFASRVDKLSMSAAAQRHVATHFDVNASMGSYRRRWLQAVAERRRESGAVKRHRSAFAPSVAGGRLAANVKIQDAPVSPPGVPSRL
jgi:glycosyltransferase involved in cell wall biosynthesis